MIKNPRIIFTPSKEFRESVLQGIQFQNAGVLTKALAMPALQTIKKQKALLLVEVMTVAAAVPEVVTEVEVN